MRTFSVVDAFSWAFKTFFNNFGLFFPAGILYFLVTNGKALISIFVCDNTGDNWWQFFINLSLCQRELGWPYTALGLLLVIVGQWLFLGLLRIAFDFYDHGTSSFDRMFSQGHLLLRGLLLVLTYSLLIGLGMVALIIPGIYLFCRYALVFPIYVDKETGIKQTFSESSTLTQGNRWKILAFFLCTILGALIPFIGVGIVILALVHVYRSLQETGSDSHVVRETLYEEEVMQS